jgi:membrane associated rhomboid family serine protease
MFPVRDHNPSHKFPFVTIALILVNTIIFLLEVFSPDLETFIQTYALIPNTINFVDVSTLYPFITSMYLHGGFFHLFSNMWFLWIFGDNIEATLGSVGFLVFYIISGIGASLLQYFFAPLSTIPTLGASGAIAGILGAYLVFFPRAKIDTYIFSFYGFLQEVQVPASFMLIYWFIIQFFSGTASLVQTNTTGGVAWWAHVGGFVVGFSLAKMLGGRREYSEN